jgi:hypothetical protein
MRTEKLVKLTDIEPAETFKSLLDGTHDFCIENKYFGRFSRRKDKMFAPFKGKFATYYNAPRIFYKGDDRFTITNEDFVECILHQWETVEREQQKVRVLMKDEGLLKLAHLEFQFASVLQMLMIAEYLDIDLRNLKGEEDEEDLRWFLGEVVQKLKKEVFTETGKEKLEKVLLNDKYIERIAFCFAEYATPEGRRIKIPSYDEHYPPAVDNMLQRLIFHATRGEVDSIVEGLASGVFGSNGLVKPSLYFDDQDGTLGGNMEFIYDLGPSKMDWMKTMLLTVRPNGKRVSEGYVKLTKENFPAGDQAAIFFLKLDFQVRFTTQGPYVRTRVAKLISKKAAEVSPPEFDRFPFGSDDEDSEEDC